MGRQVGGGGHRKKKEGIALGEEQNGEDKERGDEEYGMELLDYNNI